MGRGRKKSHKGGHRHFTSADDMEMEAEKLRKEQEWRQMKGIESEEEEDEEGDKKQAAGAEKKPKTPKPVLQGQPGELPPSDSEEESDEEDEEEDKPKGVSHLIEIENPNRVRQKQTKKVTDLNITDDSPSGEGSKVTAALGGAEAAGSGLSRREREELEKQAAKERYEKLHLAGKTDEAKADLARLALIRKQREDAAKKRELEKKAQDSAKTAAEQRLLDKKKSTDTAAAKQ